jgi:hypothetical protein
MPSLDIFNDDAFSLQSLTASIAEQPHVPGRMGQLGMFQNEGITTTQISIEKDGATLGLVAAADRGAPGQVVVGDKRTMIPFNTLHLPQTGAVMADEIQNVRAFGSETEVESVQTVVNRHLAKHRRQIDATLEHLMIGAAKGQLLDSDGSTVLVNLLTQFGISQTTHSLVLATATTKVREKVLELLDLIEDKLGGVSFTGVRVLCGRNYFKNLIGHDKVAPAWERCATTRAAVSSSAARSSSSTVVRSVATSSSVTMKPTPSPKVCTSCSLAALHRPTTWRPSTPTVCRTTPRWSRWP